ncbi:rhomboid family intramembrane serine protease [Leptolyngbyaceae cyanobacterium CCMR0082]|uniref:Rhomboid family intramembrane serine protease n=1 Tax=Adonisia turfae CCMR0082 TaxID=2304604 RepID=A0A6M0SBR2_9CYAN|nr:rhomboid family intramembrane serine protease [Adonisia turfae]MDV3352112.1 rhomboid family intramembrane serine protease [Leptothoe sp. LEGE 181152]NEZ65102.1 rhomboid family intramembrane serine protease [Adonisia turfae CCMR0082]
MTGVKQQLVLIYMILGTVILSMFVPIDWQTQAKVLRDCIIMAWVVGVVNFAYLGGGLNRLLGIRPRAPLGLLGIIFSPLLHRNAGHLIANTLPFAILGWLVLLQGIDNFYAISLAILLVSGLGTWIFGRSAIHLGASGLIFGYLGYLIARGYLEVTLMTIGLAFVVMLLYGDQFWTMLPDSEETTLSWEAHMFGFLGGVLAAYNPIFLEQLNRFLASL